MVHTYFVGSPPLVSMENATVRASSPSLASCSVATDSIGDRHIKRLELTVVQTARTPTSGVPPTPTEPPSVTATPTVERSSCTGDCNGDGLVTVNEVILGVNIALGFQALEMCPVFDQNQDGGIGINELVGAVGFGLNGCL